MVYYYGGKFNPFTKGHLSVLEGLLRHIEAAGTPSTTTGPKIVVGVKSGEMWGSEGIATLSSTSIRMDLVDMALQTVRAQYPFWDIEVVEQIKPRTWEYLQSKPEWFPEDARITLVMGNDEYEDFQESWEAEDEGADPESGKWHHAKDINTYCEIVHFPRDKFVSSTRVREIYRANPFVNYSDVSDYVQKEVHDYIVENLLYWQEGYESEARLLENLFLKGYDMTKFPRPSVTATVAVFCCRKVLLVRRKGHPFKGYWALPGGFFDVDKDPSLYETAQRELREETGLTKCFAPGSEFRSYSMAGMDPRGRIVDHIFVCDMSDHFQEFKAGDDAAEAEWWSIDKLPRMAFHHAQVINDIVNAQGREWYCGDIGGLK